MKFSNKQNEQIELPDGRIIWLSRACAVSTTVCCYLKGKPHILLAKRGEGCPDAIGKWNLPSGYLDWNETLTEAAEREVYEETGVNLITIAAKEQNVIASHMHQPWQVKSQVSKRNFSKQNISNHFYFIFSADQAPATTTENGEENEIAEVQWVEQSQLGQFEFAFLHNKVIERFFEITREITSHVTKS